MVVESMNETSDRSIRRSVALRPRASSTRRSNSGTGMQIEVARERDQVRVLSDRTRLSNELCSGFRHRPDHVPRVGKPRRNVVGVR